MTSNDRVKNEKLCFIVVKIEFIVIVKHPLSDAKEITFQSGLHSFESQLSMNAI